MVMQEHEHCQDYLRNFSDYIDGELPPDFCAELESHLKECPNCRVVFNTLQRTVELYQGNLDEEQLPGEVRSRLFARLELDDCSGKAGGDNAS